MSYFAICCCIAFIHWIFIVCQQTLASEKASNFDFLIEIIKIAQSLVITQLTPPLLLYNNTNELKKVKKVWA